MKKRKKFHLLLENWERSSMILKKQPLRNKQTLIYLKDVEKITEQERQVERDTGGASEETKIAESDLLRVKETH